MKDLNKAFSNLVGTVKALRTPNTGCPWDLEQDHVSLRPYLIEEVYEVLDAIESGDDMRFRDELGDLLLQVLLHAQVANDRGSFDICDVINDITEKMIRRHPHVFGDVNVHSSAEVLINWEKIKLTEQHVNNSKTESESKTPITDKLTSIPKSIPSLLRAQRMGEKAARVSFDWQDLSGVHGKVHEELSELEEEMKTLPKLNKPASNVKFTNEQKRAVEYELGDLLFSLCQLARWLGLSAENCLSSAISKFLDRFKLMEEHCKCSLASLSPEKIEAEWEKAKKLSVNKSQK